MATKRLGNHDAKSFITLDGRAFSLEIRWPFQRYPTELSLHARLSSLLNDEVAGIYVSISDPDWEALRGQPFAKHKAVFVAARQALDASEVVFYPKSERPSQLQRVEYKPDQKPSKSNDQKIQSLSPIKLMRSGSSFPIKRQRFGYATLGTPNALV